MPTGDERCPSRAVGAQRAFFTCMKDDAVDSNVIASPWLTVHEAAPYARCGVKVLYRAVRNGRLRAARLGGRRELRLRREWIDLWLEEQPTN